MPFALSAVNPATSESVQRAQEPPTAERFQRVLEQQATVQPSRTPLSGTQASQAIGRAYEALTGERPSQGTLAILTSHWALETGQGAKMYNFNFAGIKGKSPEGLTAVMGTREGSGQSAVHIRSGFRAYSTAEAGAHDYVSLLQRRYAGALTAAQNEDPAGFAQQLKARGYYTGDEALYTKGIVRLANSAMARGMDALGTTAGSLSAQPIQERYFAPSLRREGGPTQLADFDVSQAIGVGVGFDPNQMVDEITRAALQIAAEHGVGERGAG